MNKGTALVGFMLSFLAGAGLTWGVAEARRGERAPGAPIAAPSSQASSPIPIGADDPARGDADAPVTIVVISDFECPFCARVVPTLQQIERAYGPERVRVVWKNNPAPSHPNARPAAEAAVAVRALGGDFWKFHDLAFEHQRELTPANYARWALMAGVDAARFTAELATRRSAAKVDRDIALARQIGARGTPHFRINGKSLIGAQPLDKFKQLVDEQLAAAEALAKTGVARARLSLELTKKNFVSAPPEPAKPAAPAAVDTTIWKVPVDPDDPVRGPADALVTIVEFSDFQCPYCAKAADTIERVLREYPKDVRVVWKDVPASFHPRAKPAALFARHAYARRGDESFWAVHDALFADQEELGDAAFERIAQKLGLDWREARAAIEGGLNAAKIDRSVDLSRDFAVPGTPHYFVNGRRLSGARSFEEFQRLIEAQRVAALELVSRGVRREAVFRELMKSAKAAPEPEKKIVAPPTRDNPSKGPSTAQVTITEFSDFQCPFCSRATPVLDSLLAAHRKDVRLVWRHMPLSSHPDAALAAEAAQEAFAQQGNEGFWQYHDRLFQNQKAIGRADLERHAGELGLDVARFNAALDSRKHKPHVDNDSEVARRAGIVATPGFVINGYFVSGAHPLDVYEKFVQLALKSR